MAQTRTVTEVARHFAEYINRVAYRGESFVLLRGKKPMAELRPLPAGKRLSELPALLESLPRLSPSEAESFADDLEAAREGLGSTAWSDTCSLLLNCLPKQCEPKVSCSLPPSVAPSFRSAALQRSLLHASSQGAGPSSST